MNNENTEQVMTCTTQELIRIVSTVNTVVEARRHCGGFFRRYWIDFEHDTGIVTVEDNGEKQQMPFQQFVQSLPDSLWTAYWDSADNEPNKEENDVR